jgi:hypothetical protein
MASHINRWVEPYCVLCRVTLPQNMYDPMIHNRDWEYTKEWDADVVMCKSRQAGPLPTSACQARAHSRPGYQSSIFPTTAPGSGTGGPSI